MNIPTAKIAVLCQQRHITKLSLFGSVLRDDFTPNSDIDILVEFEAGFTPGFLRLHDIQEELSALLDHRPIDLVTPKFLNHRIRDNVLATAEVCYDAKDDQVYLGHMIDTAHKALNLVDGVSREEFDHNETLRLALTHLIQIIGESARRVSRDFRAAYPQIPWKGIVGMRSKVVHDYLNVDEDIVWSTVTDDLPALMIELEKILN
ncbi:MAG: DUF86 domain-containing protein [Leptolyngbya sp. RL_3_1]|nr:DUF86 domain-containing protein [Leptolyngbya sp. RL_3_1]